MRTEHLVSVLIVLFAVDAAYAQTTPAESAALGQALDRPFDELSIRAEPVPQALAELGRRAGIAITIHPDAMDLLPWGAETRFAEVTLRHASLREALGQILPAVGMTYEEADDGITVVASNPLKRMNRRATWDDLRLLRSCYETPYSPENVANFKFQYRITSKVNAPEMLAEQLTRTGRGSVADMLETGTGALGWTWFPNGDHIVIMTYQAQIAHRLARRVTIRYHNQPLAQILTDLAKRADVALDLEPGMMLKLPPSTAQSYTLSLQRASLREALEAISAETGLKYEMTRDGLTVGLAENIGAAAPSAAGRRSTYAGRIMVPSKDGSFSYEFLIREDELPPDVLQYRRELLDATIQKIRSEMTPDATIRPAEPPDRP